MINCRKKYETKSEKYKKFIKAKNLNLEKIFESDNFIAVHFITSFRPPFP